VGGYFGPYLKFSGFDGLEIQGKTQAPTVILIDGIRQQIRILEVTGLPAQAHEISEVLTHHFGRGKPRNISVVSTGPAAKHALIGCLNFSWYDAKRSKTRLKQAGRGGLGLYCRQGPEGDCRPVGYVTTATNNPWTRQPSRRWPDSTPRRS